MTDGPLPTCTAQSSLVCKHWSSLTPTCIGTIRLHSKLLEDIVWPNRKTPGIKAQGVPSTRHDVHMHVHMLTHAHTHAHTGLYICMYTFMCEYDIDETLLNTEQEHSTRIMRSTNAEYSDTDRQQTERHYTTEVYIYL